MRGKLRTVTAALWIAVTLQAGALHAQPAADGGGVLGVLLMAHGGSAAWNDHVSALAAKVDATLPTEVAFGMATRAAIQSAVDRLAARGVTRITAVPLFVSSHSSVITSTEYLLGVRAEAPPELATFARMKHGSGGGHDAHAGHAAPADPTSRVTLPVPLRMTTALDADAAVSDVLAARAREISRDPAREAVVLVAHGPVRDEENSRWLRDLAVHVDRLKQAIPFASVEALTVRDDAPAPIRDAATAEFRGLVSRQIAEGRRVLIVPVLLSFGGIEAGVRKRLDGLDYTMATKGLIPDDRFVAWVLGKAAATPSR